MESESRQLLTTIERGKKHVWRIYDYPHVIAMYYYMYQVAKFYPSTTKYLNDDGYLERAFGTAKAFFTVPDELIKWSADKTGTYDELVIPALIQALYDGGHKDQGDWLRNAWEKKVEYFINEHPYLFGSEYPFDSTGFESTEAFARYAMLSRESSQRFCFGGSAANRFQSCRQIR